MSTRGICGFYKDGITKASYNHSDSYPSGLGKDVVGFINKHSIEEMNNIFTKITLVTENDKELDNAEGNLSVYAQIGYMLDSQDFLKDSLFCEWGYIINLDSNVLEVYKGFQNKKTNTRYQPEKDEGGYWGCALIASIELTDPELLNKVEKLEG